MNILYELINNDGIRILGITICLDSIFGILRALRERSINSAIGIDGVIRKVGMIISVFFLFLIDGIIELDLIGFIPEEIKTILNFETIGLADLFMLLFILFESLSIIKNMILCKLPIPKKLQNFLEKAMKEFTGEISE